MQTKLNGVQLKMKRYRGMPLKQALGDIEGRRKLTAKRKKEKKQQRIADMKGSKR